MSALNVRRLAVVVAPLLSAVLIVAGSFSTRTLPGAAFVVFAGQVCAQAVLDGFGLLIFAASIVPEPVGG